MGPPWLEKFGPNAMPDTALHPLRMALEKFWAPVPWMLEAAILLQIVLGKGLRPRHHRSLVFNAALGLFQEGRAQTTLPALKSRSRSWPRSGAMAPGKPYRPLSWFQATW